MRRVQEKHCILVAVQGEDRTQHARKITKEWVYVTERAAHETDLWRDTSRPERPVLINYKTDVTGQIKW